MLLIDEKGDYLYNVPHIYMDFRPAKGPFERYLYRVERGTQGVELEEKEYKRIGIFPDPFPEVKVGTIYQDIKLKLDTITLRALSFGHPEGNKTYYVGDTYDFLKEGDTIAIADPPKEWYQNGIRITFIEKKSASEMVDQSENREIAMQDLARRLGKTPNPDEPITLLEFKQVFMPADKDKS